MYFQDAQSVNTEPTLTLLKHFSVTVSLIAWPAATTMAMVATMVTGAIVIAIVAVAIAAVTVITVLLLATIFAVFTILGTRAFPRALALSAATFHLVGSIVVVGSIVAVIIGGIHYCRAKRKASYH